MKFIKKAKILACVICMMHVSCMVAETQQKVLTSTPKASAPPTKSLVSSIQENYQKFINSNKVTPEELTVTTPHDISNEPVNAQQRMKPQPLLTKNQLLQTKFIDFNDQESNTHISNSSELDKNIATSSSEPSGMEKTPSGTFPAVNNSIRANIIQSLYQKLPTRAQVAASIPTLIQTVKTALGISLTKKEEASINLDLQEQVSAMPDRPQLFHVQKLIQRAMDIIYNLRQPAAKKRFTTLYPDGSYDVQTVNGAGDKLITSYKADKTIQKTIEYQENGDYTETVFDTNNASSPQVRQFRADGTEIIASPVQAPTTSQVSKQDAIDIAQTNQDLAEIVATNKTLYPPTQRQKKQSGSLTMKMNKPKIKMNKKLYIKKQTKPIKPYRYDAPAEAVNTKIVPQKALAQAPLQQTTNSLAGIDMFDNAPYSASYYASPSNYLEEFPTILDEQPVQSSSQSYVFDPERGVYGSQIHGQPYMTQYEQEYYNNEF